MKKYKGQILFAILMCVLSVVLIGKASDNKKEKHDAIELSSNQDDIDNVVDIWYSYSGYEKYLEAAIAEFKKNNSEYEFNLKFVSEPAYFDYISEQSKNGNGPDLYIMASEYLEKAYLLGILEENDDDIYNEENYEKTALKAITYDSKLFGMPMGFDVAALLYNADLVDYDINTFEDIKRFADDFNDTMSDDENTDALDGNQTDSGNQNDSGEQGSSAINNIKSIFLWDVNNLLFNYGFIGNNIVIDGKEKNVSISNEEVLKATEQYLLLKDYFSLSGQDKYDEIIESFAKGEVVFTIAGTNVVSKIGTGINYKIVEMPDLSSDIKCNGLSYTDMIAVNPRGNNKQIAEKLAKFVSYEYAEKMYDLCGIVSCRKDISYDDQHINDMCKVYGNAINMPNLLATEDYCIVMEEAIKSIWNGDAPKDIFDNLQKKYNERVK